jgi:hypothetical protein
LRLNALVPKNLKLVLANALFLAGLALVVSAASPSGQETALADPPGNDGVCEHARSEKDCRDDPQPDHGKDCDPHGANFDGNEDHCKTKTPTATPETPTATNTPETPTATPETPTATATATNTPTDATGAAVQPTATPELIIEAVETAVAEEEAVAEVAALPASGSGGSSSTGTSFQLGLGIATMALGSLLGFFGLKMDAKKETS